MIPLTTALVVVGSAGLVLTLLFQNFLPPPYRAENGPFIFAFLALIALGAVIAPLLIRILH